MAETPEEYEESDEEEDLQFSSVEAATPGPPPIGPQCVACHRPIADVYFAAGDKVVCAACRDQYEGAVRSGSKVGRLAMATLLGIVAGLIGAAIWYGIRYATQREYGLVAIGVGLLVGGAVRKGSGGRGGRGYQFLAVFLTYLAVGVNYAPDLVMAGYHKFKESQGITSRTSNASGPSATRPATRLAAIEKPATTQDAKTLASVPPVDEAESGESDAPPPPHMGPGAFVLGVLVLAALAVGVVLIGPILVGFSSIIGAVIVAIALWEAWKINAGRRVAMMGPYSLSNRPPPSLPPLPPMPPPGGIRPGSGPAR